MPVNRLYNLGDLKKALAFYFNNTSRQVFFEYIMFKDLNDGEDQANELIELVKSIRGGVKLIHVNLIRYNAAAGDFLPSDDGKVRKFRNYLARQRIGVTIRKSLGEEIKGACGQLAKNK